MRHQELNLLTVFDAIMTEGSITRAAERLAMTQPAVSNTVSRMRSLWKDEVFIKDGRNIQPTLYAKNLWAEIKEPLQQLDRAITPTAFEPGTAKRTFRIASADAIIDIAWKPLRQIIEREAPNINVYAMPYTIVNGQQLLDDAEVDLVIGTLNIVPSMITSTYLFSSCYVCVMRPDHPLAKADLTLTEFAAADHLLVSLSGDTVGFTDQALAQHGLKRRIAMTVNHFSAVSSLLQSSNLIAIVPSTVMENDIFSKKLAVTCPPVDIPQNQLNCYWHKRQENDPALIWIRDKISAIIRTYAEAHYEKLDGYFCKKC